MCVKRSLCTALVLAGFGFVSAAQATAISDVVVSSTLTIDSISSSAGDLDNLLIEGFASVSDSDATADGNALASADGVTFPDVATPLGEGDAVENVVLVSTSADPEGVGDALFFTDGELLLENLSDTATFTIGLEFAYDITASASVDDPINEFAVALANLSLDSLLQNAFLLEELVSIDTDLNPQDDPIFISDVLAFDVVLAPGDVETLLVLADGESQSVAFAAVPLPASLSLFMLGLAGLGLRSRFKLRA